ncbi:MAG: serine/threonine-protein kinase [Planctomycetota bacterium]
MNAASRLTAELEALVGRRPESAALPGLPGFEAVAELSRGGQGVVYRAVERATGRAVAIKVLSPHGARSRRDRLRFAREVDAVSRLRHPGIVTLLQSAFTDRGDPYFVMPLLDARPLHDYVAEERLDVPSTLRLFTRVAEAVHYAHRRGVLHRDLKPSNVLVDESGAPCVLDFGLAKAIDSEITVTELGDFAGTIGYASPEQVTGQTDRVEARSDIYSLGVLLYTLVAGRHPFEGVRGLPELCTRLLRETPPPPSHHRPSVPADIDTIVAKAMSSDIERRYETVHDFARDVELHLDGRPIQARSDSAWYVVSRTLARHRGAALGIALVACALLAATVVSLTALGRTRRALHRVEVERATAVEAKERADYERGARHQVSRFLWDVLSIARERGADGPAEPTVREALLRGAPLVADLVDPLARGLLHDQFGMVFNELGMLELAEHHLDAAHADLGAMRSVDEETYRRLRKNLAVVRGQLGDAGYAERELREHLCWVESRPSSLSRWSAQRDLASVLLRREAFGEADALLSEALVAARAELGDDALEALRTALARAEALVLAHRPAAARPLAERTLAQLLAVHPRMTRDAIAARNLVARCAELLGEHGDAVAWLEQSLAEARARLIEGDVLIESTRNNLAGALLQVGRSGEAAEHFRAVVEALADALGPDHATTLVTRTNLGQALQAAGRPGEAEHELRAVVDDMERALGPSHPHAVNALNALAWLVGSDGRRAEAIAMLDEALARSVLDEGWFPPYMRANRAHFLALLGRDEEARDELEASHARLVELLGADSPHARAAASLLERVAARAGQ